METKEIFVNDRARRVDRGATVQQVVEELALANATGIALAVNDLVVPRSAWRTHALAAGDRVLILQATQGG